MILLILGLVLLGGLVWSGLKLTLAKATEALLLEDNFWAESGLGASLWDLASGQVWPRIRDNLNSPLGFWEVPAEAEWEAVEKNWEEELAVSSKPELLDLGKWSGQVLVGIYHTHTGETYRLTDGVDRIEGEGGVVKAGTVLTEHLEKVGIKTAHSHQVNDQSYNEAYNHSWQTAVNLLAENPEIQILLDLHRDSEKKRSQSMVEINGQKMATVLFVSGSDARASFPNWRKNKAFAEQVAERLNEKYPGLCKGVTVREGRYNQFLHERALLVEIGNTNNTLEEAEASAAALAEVLSEILVEIAANED